MEKSENTARTQEECLQKILRGSAGTEYGRSLGLTGNEGYDEFVKLVTPQKYEEHLLPWIERQVAEPDKSIFCSGGLRVLEKSSGSSGRAKLIPYNKKLLKTFDHYFRVWAYDILKNGPRFKSFRTYISISPSQSSDRESGFSDDSEYLSWPLRILLKPFLAVPLDLKKVKDPAEFRHLLCTHLVSADDLEIISIWHPSLFLVLMEYIKEHRLEIAKTLRNDIRFRAKTSVLNKLEGNLELAELWPNLKLISAWDGANSGHYADKLKNLFPHALFQAKGLLSTEAPITLPILAYGAIPFQTDIFLEFVHSIEGVKRLQDLQVGERYRVLVTQASGFLRYDLGDEVLVTDFKMKNCPNLQFVGRSGQISDLVGEKLTEENFQNLHRQFSEEYSLRDLCVLPIATLDSTPHYLFLYEADFFVPPSSFEMFLKSHYHYGYARDLGQLQAAKAVRIIKLSEFLLEFYTEKRKMRLGDIKLKLLVKNPLEAQEILQYKIESGALYEIS